MDDLLARAGNQAVTFAIRSGISLVSGYAIRSLTRFLEKLPEDEKESLEKIKRRLNTKIKIVTPAIDLIQLIAARGNTSLDSTVSLTRALRRDINEFDTRVEQASQRMQIAKSTDERRKAAKSVEQYMLGLLSRIEDSIPLISLALTTSGANLSASLPDTVSPSRLLQASAFLLAADSAYASRPFERHQVGPRFTLKLYTVFYGTARNPHTTTSGDITWKEEYPKCYIEIFRIPIRLEDNNGEQSKNTRRDATGQTYSYELVVTEDLDDGRYHEEFDSKNPPKPDANGVIQGRSRIIPLSIITRLFFSASGRLLEIDDAISPVLVVKLNKAFLQQSSYFMFDDSSSSDEDEFAADWQSNVDETDGSILATRVDSPANIEWLAFELWADDVERAMYEDEEDENDNIDEEVDEAENLDSAGTNNEKLRPSIISEATLASAFSRLALSSADIEAMIAPRRQQPSTATSTQSGQQLPQQSAQSLNSLSLLEYIIRLAALQTNDQASALNISDERIALYLRDENRTTTREAARDVSDPIGSSPSPALASRYVDSGSRQRRSRSSTPTTTPVGAAVRGSGSSVTGGDSGLRRSSRLRSSPVESTTAAGAEATRRYPVVQNLASGAAVSASAPTTTAHPTIRNGATPKTPRTVIPRHKQATNATGNANGNDTSSLTPWELDRLQALEPDAPSPLDGKTTRRRRSGRIG
ncbi:RanGTP-binding protein-domain-containing protein [Lipomyces tetrasporus]|uniref:RanGTP-binding protein-domain-containing protein n=1 Tax=Lipomyces tetrasporus TaxID=54092 RepID=A0AAD7R064_9ASCO|nr:RanGTP-binding protein-domain-containing protein [Lipomyces tetrasporus]KAJ8104106.1 RanGTP-binding protein-domain-containing protein [Lipomyces tetrasporus]